MLSSLKENSFSSSNEVGSEDVGVSVKLIGQLMSLCQKICGADYSETYGIGTTSSAEHILHP